MPELVRLLCTHHTALLPGEDNTLSASAHSLGALQTAWNPVAWLNISPGQDRILSNYLYQLVSSCFEFATVSAYHYK